MISRNAIYDWLEAIIADDDAPECLADAVLYRSLKGPIDVATRKVIRVECYSGRWALTHESSREEQDVDFVIECIVSPLPSNADNPEEVRIEEAKEKSFEMGREIFRLMASSGVPGVCSAYGDEWEIGEPSFGASNRGATYFYGKVNNEN
jgi:hypothetical protein